MRLFRKSGVDTVSITKAEARQIMQGVYIGRQMVRCMGDNPAAKGLSAIVEGFADAAKRYGAAHFDDKGELKMSEKEKAVAQVAP